MDDNLDISETCLYQQRSQLLYREDYDKLCEIRREIVDDLCRANIERKIENGK